MSSARQAVAAALAFIPSQRRSRVSEWTVEGPSAANESPRRRGTRLANTLGMNLTSSHEAVRGPASLRVLEPLTARPMGSAEPRVSRRLDGRRSRTAPPRLGLLRLAPRLTVVGSRRPERRWEVIAGRIGAAVADGGAAHDGPLIA